VVGARDSFVMVASLRRSGINGNTQSLSSYQIDTLCVASLRRSGINGNRKFIVSDGCRDSSRFSSEKWN